MSTTMANAGARGAPRRAPVSAPAQTHAIISVEQWEALAPLGDVQLKSVAAVKAAVEKSSSTFRFPQNEAGPSRPSTPLASMPSKLPSSRPSTPTPSSQSQVSHLHPPHPIRTPEQFYDWHASLDRAVAHGQEAHFRAHLAALARHLDLCDRLVERGEEVDQEVTRMMEEWRRVEEGGESMKEACERLLEERDALLELQDALGARLDYFAELEHATRMLNHPGEALVLQTDFLYMVERVDVCIEFLKGHRHYKEADIYLLRFEQCMTRAMTLVKMYAVGSLRALAQDVARRLGENDVSPTAQSHLLYTRFATVAATLSPLLSELERRAAAHPASLSALLDECHAAYFSARRSLLVARIAEEVKGLEPGRAEVVELTRAGCSYLKQLCTDEFELHRSFFASGEDQLYAYLETLCDYLYDDLRPRILHEQRISALCDVCTVLQALMVLDAPAPEISTEVDSDEEDVFLTNTGVSHGNAGTLHISRLLQMVLQDAQTRLFFKAQAVIQSEIRYYVPKTEDLAYPDKIVAARTPMTGLREKERESVRQLFGAQNQTSLASLERRDTWFPTLDTTARVLAQLHDFVQPAIFDDLAQEAITLCRHSLCAAAEMIEARAAGAALDAHLFLVRHLLILKEMTRNLAFGETSRDEVGVSGHGIMIGSYGMTDTLAAMVSRTTSMLPDSLVASLGMPRGDADILDAKHGIDMELKRTCEGVIDDLAEPLCTPLREFVAQVDAHRNAALGSTNTKTGPVTAHSWAQQEVAEKLDADFRSLCARELRAGAARVGLYLEDRRTADVLLSHVRERAAEVYCDFADLVGSMYAGTLKGRVLDAARVNEVLREATDEREE